MPIRLGLEGGKRISGATTPTLSISAAVVADAGAYDCEIRTASSAPCVIVSSSATLTVEPPPACTGDLTGDGFVDGRDLNILLTNWGCAVPGCAGDLNNDAVVDSTDIGVLLANWGCQIE